MSVDPGIFGVGGFAFPVAEGGVACDYPDEDDVRSGIVYGSGTYTGTLLLPGVSDDPTSTTHSPADVIRWLLVDLGQLSDYRRPGAWPGYVNVEPQTPDNVVTVYDTAGREDGRSMATGEVWSHYGISVRVRAATERTGSAKAWALRKFLAENISQQEITLDAATYLVWCLSNVGQPNALEMQESASKRRIWTINALASIRRLEE